MNQYQQCNSPVIVALDYAQRQAALALAQQLDPSQCRLKIGFEMFTRYGAEIVRDLQRLGFDIFLDLKFHDIPNTINHAIAAAADPGVWMVNVHACGGARMLEAAKEALLPFGNDAQLLIAVTLLTSMDKHDLQTVGISEKPEAYAHQLALLTQRCGLDGVVCSAHEAVQIKESCGNEFKLVTPGIRPAGSAAGDQRRIMTPTEAQAVGVDYMVIGRPITQAADPAQALSAILTSLKQNG